MQEWRAKNKEHVTGYAKAYKADKSQDEGWKAKKREADIRYYEETVRNNPEQLVRYRLASNQWGRDNKEKRTAAAAVRRKADPEKHNAAARVAYQSLSKEERQARAAARSEYQRKYRAAHAEEIKEAQRLHYLGTKETYANDNKLKYATDASFRDAAIARAKARYEKDRQAGIDKAAQWAKDNPERAKDNRKSSWRARFEDDPLPSRANTALRRARRLAAEGNFTAEDVARLFEAQAGKCNGCRKDLEEFDVDHIMPLVLGGSNWPVNLQLLCPSCNSKKGHMHPDAWAAKIGKLFT